MKLRPQYLRPLPATALLGLGGTSRRRERWKMRLRARSGIASAPRPTVCADGPSRLSMSSCCPDRSVAEIPTTDSDAEAPLQKACGDGSDVRTLTRPKSLLQARATPWAKRLVPSKSSWMKMRASRPAKDSAFANPIWTAPVGPPSTQRNPQSCPMTRCSRHPGVPKAMPQPPAASATRGSSACRDSKVDR